MLYLLVWLVPFTGGLVFLTLVSHEIHAEILNSPVMLCAILRIQHVSGKVCVLIKILCIFSFVFHNFIA